MAPVAVQFNIELWNHLISSKISLTNATVYIVGNAEELGSWNPLNAARMNLIKEKDERSSWQLQICFHCTRSPLEYKYIIKNCINNAIICWEAIPGNRIASFFEGTNVALKKDATQSSVFISKEAPVPGPRGAQLGNDGRKNGYYEWNCCQTQNEVNPWWQVDLGKVHTILSLHLWNALTYHGKPREPAPFEHHLKDPNTNKIPLWVFISKLPLEGTLKTLKERAESCEIYGRMLNEALYKSSLQDLSVFSLFLKPPLANDAPTQACLHTNGRDSSDRITGQFVRIQAECKLSSLRFIECEVYAADTCATIKSVTYQHDGVFGVENSLSGFIRATIDDGWISPQDDDVEIKLWIEGFDERNFALGMNHLGGMNGKISMNVDCSARQRTIPGTADAAINNLTKWKPVIVEAQGSYAIRSASEQLFTEFARYQARDSKSISQYLNIIGDSASNATTCCETKMWGSNSSQSVSPNFWLRKLPWTKKLSEQEMQKLQDSAQNKVYGPHECLLAYGERKHAMWYITSGIVYVYGPLLAGKGQLLGSIAAGSYFNDLSLFGVPDGKCASFMARDRVQTELITQEALTEALGLDRAMAFRLEIINNLHTDLDPQMSSNRNVVDGEHGQSFRVKVPSHSLGDADQRLTEFRLSLNLYGNVTGTTEQLAKAYILSSQLCTNSEGVLTVPVFSAKQTTEDLLIVSEVTVRYLIIKPMKHDGNNLQCVWRSYWRERPPLNIGHRGMGRSYHQVDGYRRALFRENSLASFILAGRNGADFVEFDVQLTKDKVPVLYHDFSLKVGLEDQHAWSRNTGAEEHLVGIHELTFRQLTRCLTKPRAHCVSQKGLLRQRITKHWRAILKESAATKKLGVRGIYKVDNTAMVDPKPLTDNNLNVPFTKSTAASPREIATESGFDHLVDFFPRLEDLLHYVPAHVGLNVEIKYPDIVEHQSLRRLDAFDLNIYVDAILECIFKNAGSRRIFFSSFDVSVCVMLRRKQVKYPVFLLNCGILHCAESRCPNLTLEFAVTMAEIEDLQGIVIESQGILKNLEIVRFLKETKPKMKIMTWGDRNTNYEAFQAQKQYAVDAVISDNIGDLIRQERACANQDI